MVVYRLYLYTTLPYHHTLYVTLSLPYRTPYPVYHRTLSHVQKILQYMLLVQKLV